jgi:amino acid transporter
MCIYDCFCLSISANLFPFMLVSIFVFLYRCKIWQLPGSPEISSLQKQVLIICNLRDILVVLFFNCFEYDLVMSSIRWCSNSLSIKASISQHKKKQKRLLFLRGKKIGKPYWKQKEVS